MKVGKTLGYAGVACTLAIVAGCAGGGGGGSSGGSDINKPGSWAYEGCKQGLLERIQRDHPQVKSVQIEGHVSEVKETDSRSVLTGEGKFPKNGDNFHFTFECKVNRDLRQVQQVKYDKAK